MNTSRNSSNFREVKTKVSPSLLWRSHFSWIFRIITWKFQQMWTLFEHLLQVTLTASGRFLDAVKMQSDLHNSYFYLNFGLSEWVFLFLCLDYNNTNGWNPVLDITLKSKLPSNLLLWRKVNIELIFAARIWTYDLLIRRHTLYRWAVFKRCYCSYVLNLFKLI